MQITCNCKKDASTDTQGGKLSEIWLNENDEMFSYIENTELLIASKLPVEQGASGDKNLQIPLRKSLFAHVPQYIVFQITDNPKISPFLQKHLSWKRSGKSSPKVLYKTLKNSGFSLNPNLNDSWLGVWIIPPSTIKTENLKPFQKINHFPGIHELSNKVQLWKNYRKMRQKFGSQDFDYMPTCFIIPEEAFKLKQRLSKEREIWIIKPPNSCAGQGIRVISKYSEIPRNLPFIAQNYLIKPKLINDLKFDLRLYVLLTNLNPLRIYLYSEGLIRFATQKYSTNVRYLYDKFMHLTNTSINKFSPSFKENDSIDACKGNMWSLHSLWTYLSKNTDADIPKLWNHIKDMIIKTIISAENDLIKMSQKVPSSYNTYQLLGFDIILDKNLKPWLLEVNSCPSMVSNTPLCAIVKGQLAENFLNILGFHLPDTITEKEMKTLSEKYDERVFCYDHRLYDCKLNDQEIEKQRIFSSMKNRGDYLRTILQYLTADDVRILIRHEDENSQCGSFEKIFPTPNTHVYFKYFQKIRYYNLLLDSWECTYANERKNGIKRLQKLCREKIHLRV